MHIYTNDVFNFKFKRKKNAYLPKLAFLINTLLTSKQQHNVDLRELKESKNNSRHPWEVARLKVVNKLMQTYLPQLKSDTHFTLLDVGCGDTWFLEQLTQRFTKATLIGIDTAFDSGLLSALSQKFAQTNISVFDSVDVAKPKITQPVKVVLLLDVIEHIEDDIAFLKWLQTFSFITSETMFIISVPAYQNLFCEHDVFLGHYRRYTNPMLKSHIEQAGLTPVKLGYFFATLLPPRVLQVCIEKLSSAANKRQTKGLADWKPAPLKDKIITKVLYTDFYITFLLKKLGLNLPGLSNYVLCKKSA